MGMKDRMKNDKKVSIVVPVYNGEKYLRDAVESILRSDHANLEVLLVDDGSTDGSRGLCGRLAQGDSRVFLHVKENGGVVSARNYGVSMATGDYLCFCDQDDIVDKSCYSMQLSKMEADRSDICMCSVGRSFDGRTSAFEMSEDACYENDEILGQLLYPMLFNGFDVPVGMGERSRYPNIWSCMFRMGFWREHGFRFRSYANFEDDLLVKIEAFAKARRISTIAHIGYYWRVNLRSETYLAKYIENIAEKQQEVYDDMHRSIAGRIGDGEILGLFRKTAYCRQYLDAVHNIASKSGKKTAGEIRAYYDDNIYSRDFGNCIAAVRHVKKNRVKPSIVLGLLAKRRTMASYHAEKVLDAIMRVTLRSRTLTRIERMTKGIKVLF